MGSSLLGGSILQTEPAGHNGKVGLDSNEIISLRKIKTANCYEQTCPEDIPI